MGCGRRSPALIAVLATIDGGLTTDITRRVAAARVPTMAQVTDIGRHGISVALRLALVVMPLTALAGVPIIHWVAPAEDFALGIGLWLEVVVYQTIGWYYALLARGGDRAAARRPCQLRQRCGALVSAVVWSWPWWRAWGCGECSWACSPWEPSRRRVRCTPAGS